MGDLGAGFRGSRTLGGTRRRGRFIRTCRSTCSTKGQHCAGQITTASSQVARCAQTNAGGSSALTLSGPSRASKSSSQDRGVSAAAPTTASRRWRRRVRTESGGADPPRRREGPRSGTADPLRREGPEVTSLRSVGCRPTPSGGPRNHLTEIGGADPLCREGPPNHLTEIGEGADFSPSVGRAPESPHRDGGVPTGGARTASSQVHLARGLPASMRSTSRPPACRARECACVESRSPMMRAPRCSRSSHTIRFHRKCLPDIL